MWSPQVTVLRDDSSGAAALVRLRIESPLQAHRQLITPREVGRSSGNSRRIV